MAEFNRYFRDPAKRDPRGFILPADQPDFLTATKFVNRLIGTGVTVHRATADFEVAGEKYPKGSYVVKAAQAVSSIIIVGDMSLPPDAIAFRRSRDTLTPTSWRRPEPVEAPR